MPDAPIRQKTQYVAKIDAASHAVGGQHGAVSRSETLRKLGVVTATTDRARHEGGGAQSPASILLEVVPLMKSKVDEPYNFLFEMSDGSDAAAL
jgi:hypothetical protein